MSTNSSHCLLTAIQATNQILHRLSPESSNPSPLFALPFVKEENISGLLYILKIKHSTKENAKKWRSFYWSWCFTALEVVWVLENLPQVIHMSDSKQIFNISCPLFRVIASEIDYSTKCHPCEIGCENKRSKSEESIKGTSQGESHNKSTKSAENPSLVQWVCPRPRHCNIST